VRARAGAKPGAPRAQRDRDRRGAPIRAAWAIAAFAMMVAGFQVAYRIMIR